MRWRLLFVIAVLSAVLMSAPAMAEQECAPDDVDCWMKLLERDDAPALRAAMRLGQLGAEQAVPLLIKKLASHDQYQATAALHALIQIGRPAVLPLVEATRSENAAVRRYAVYALGKIGGGDVIDAIALLARDKDATVRRQAAVAFGSLRDWRGLLQLFELLRDNYVDVRVAAAEAIGQIGDPRAADQLIDNGLCDLAPDMARATTHALVQFGEPAVESLITAYDNKPDFARKRILTALGGIGATASKPVKDRIIKMCLLVLNRRSESAEVRAVAAYELGALEAQNAIEALKAVLTETGQQDSEPAKQLAAACRAALDKIYQRYNLTRDY
jgi:HEAT repeat protein